MSEFHDEIGTAHLRKYIDESGEASRKLSAFSYWLLDTFPVLATIG